MMRVTVGGVRESIRTSLWFVPSLFVAAAIGVWVALRRVDEATNDVKLSFAFQGGPQAAQEVLSAITSSMVVFTGVVFSVTVVALQLASSQFSPRVLRNFMRDRRTQFTLGLFIATFVYSLLVLRDVRLPTRANEAVYVPRVSTTVALVILLCSVGMFVSYIHHTAQSIRASRVILAAADEARTAFDDFLPAADEPGAVSAEVAAAQVRGADSCCVASLFGAPRPGYVVGFARGHLVQWANKRQMVVLALVKAGDFVPEGQPILRVEGAHPVDDEDGAVLCRRVHIGPERIGGEDLRYPLRQLVDIALRALSPSLNDPTTAVQSLDQLHDLLRRLVRSALPANVHRDQDGLVRFVEPAVTWDELMSLAFDEIIESGRDSLQIRQKLRAVAMDLLSFAPQERRPPIEMRLAVLPAAD